MKIFLALLLGLFPLSAAVCLTPGASSSTSGSPQPRILTIEGLRNFLLNTTWSWHRPNGPQEKLQFFEDGTARHTAFVAKFQVKSSREVELRIGKDKAKLTFDEDYARFHGIDFNGSRPIEGERQNGH